MSHSFTDASSTDNDADDGGEGDDGGEEGDDIGATFKAAEPDVTHPSVAPRYKLMSLCPFLKNNLGFYTGVCERLC